MTKKFRENFYFVLATNTTTIALVIVFYTLLDMPSNTEYLQIDRSLGVISCFFVSAIIFIIGIICYLLTQSNDSDEQIEPSQADSGSLPSDNIQALRLQYNKTMNDKYNTKMTAIKEYTYQVFFPYMDDKDIENLIYNIEVWKMNGAKFKDCNTSNSISTLDLKHYAWNIGKRLGWTGEEKAQFLKLSFPRNFLDIELETIRRNLRAKGKCIIEIDVPDKGCWSFHNKNNHINNDAI